MKVMVRLGHASWAREMGAARAIASAHAIPASCRIDTSRFVKTQASSLPRLEAMDLQSLAKMPQGRRANGCRLSDHLHETGY
jgi:hypothetical protein